MLQYSLVDILLGKDVHKTLSNSFAVKSIIKNNLANMLTAMRMVVAVAMLVLYFSNAKNWLWRCLALFVFGCLTDVVDGTVARLTNSVSDVGKLLDPICDKSMQISMALILTLGGYVYKWVFITLAIKELTMLVGASVFFKKKIIVSSNWVGKISTVWFSFAAGLAIFELKPYCDWAFVVSVILAITAMVQYGIKYIKVLKNS